MPTVQILCQRPALPMDAFRCHWVMESNCSLDLGKLRDLYRSVPRRRPRRGCRGSRAATRTALWQATPGGPVTPTLHPARCRLQKKSEYIEPCLALAPEKRSLLLCNVPAAIQCGSNSSIRVCSTELTEAATRSFRCMEHHEAWDAPCSSGARKDFCSMVLPACPAAASASRSSMTACRKGWVQGSG